MRPMAAGGHMGRDCKDCTKVLPLGGKKGIGAETIVTGRFGMTIGLGVARGAPGRDEMKPE